MDKQQDPYIVEGVEARRLRLLREAQEQNKLSDLEAKESQERLNTSFQASREGVPEHVILMVIAYDTKAGQVQVQGPIGDKIRAYGMLELARDCIYDYNKAHIPGVINS